MNQIHIANILQQAFFKLKSASHFMLISFVVLLSLGSSDVFGESVVHTVKTPINISYDGKELKYTATQNTVEAAVRQAGVVLSDFDITKPDRESRLNGGNLNIEVVRALPVLISDNNQERLVYSAFSSAEDILRQIDIEYDKVDKVSTELIMDPVMENAVGQKVIIQRAPTYNVKVDGETKYIKSWGKNVREIILGNVNLGPRDIVSPSLDTGIVGDVAISITRVNEVETEETKVVPFETIYKNDYNLFEGKSNVTQAGINGQKKEKYKVIYHNGREISRQLLSSETISTVQNKIVQRGVKPYDAGALWDILVAAGTKYGVDPSAMYRVMMCESGGRVRATNPAGYKGLFQWDSSFYKWSADAGFPGADIYDPTAQIYATALRVNKSGGWYAWGCKP